MVREETDKKINDLQTRHCVAGDLERYVRCVETQRKTKMGYRETKARQRQKIAWYLLRWSWWWGFQRHHEECAKKVGNTDASRNALHTSTVRSTGKPVALTSARHHTLALTKPMTLWGSAWKDLFTRIMKIILQEKGRIHSLQTSAQIYSFCLKQWKHQMQRQQWEKIGKTRENTGKTAVESQKQNGSDCRSKDCGKIKSHGNVPDTNCLDQFLFREPSDLEHSPERSDGESCCFQNFRKFREFWSWKQKMATSFSHVSSISTSHGESLFDFRKVYGRSPTDELNDLDVNNAVWCKFMNVTLSSPGSSWSRPYGESTSYQESAPEVSETVIPSDWKVDHGSDRNRWSDHDLL